MFFITRIAFHYQTKTTLFGKAFPLAFFFLCFPLQSSTGKKKMLQSSFKKVSYSGFHDRFVQPNQYTTTSTNKHPDQKIWNTQPDYDKATGFPIRVVEGRLVINSWATQESYNIKITMVRHVVPHEYDSLEVELPDQFLLIHRTRSISPVSGPPKHVVVGLTLNDFNQIQAAIEPVPSNPESVMDVETAI